MTGAQGTAEWDQSSLWRVGNTECSIHLESSEAEEVSGGVEKSCACFSNPKAEYVSRAAFNSDPGSNSTGIPDRVCKKRWLQQ